MPLHTNSLEFYYYTMHKQWGQNRTRKFFGKTLFIYIKSILDKEVICPLLSQATVKSGWGHFNCCDNINHLTVYKLTKNGLIV